MGNEGTDADHVEVEGLKEFDVAGEHLVGLAGDANHDSAADLVAEGAQFAEEGDAVADGRAAAGMDGGVERGVGGLEAEEITVGPGFAPEAKFIGQALAEAEGDGERGFVFYGAKNLSEPCGLDSEVLAGLQDDRAEAEFDCGARAGKNLFARHAVAGHGVGGAQAAVVALADAEAGDLDESAQVDVVADVGAAD